MSVPTTDLRQPTWLTSRRLALAGLLVFSLLVRGTALWVMRDNLNQDPDGYREIAENLLRHGEFALGKSQFGDGVSNPIPTAYRPPLYPILLSNLPAVDGQRVSLVKVAALHLILGIATVWLTSLTAQRWIHGQHWLAVPLAGTLIACDPILLNQQSLLMTESLAAFLAILSLWCLARFDGSPAWFNAALAGGAIGLAILCRPIFLPWLGLVAMAMLFADFRFQIANFRFRAVGQRLANAAGLLLVAAAVTAPWAIRNYRVFGKPIVTTTHGGYTLLLGNNESYYKWLVSDETGLPWTTPAISEQHTHILGNLNLMLGMDSSPTVTVPQGELEIDRKSYETAQRCIEAHPELFIKACLYRISQLWSPLPHKLTNDESAGRRLLRYATCAWYCGVYALAAVGVWRLWRIRRVVGTAHPTRPWIWGLLLCLVLTAVHTFYWTNLRMRAPLMPFIAMVAAAATSSTFKVRSSKLLNPEP